MFHKPIQIILLLATILAGCNFSIQKDNKETAIQDFGIENYIATDQIDTLLTDLATYIGVKPRIATSQTRFEPQYRQFYVQQARQFKMVFFFVNDQGEHFYYLIRPARSTHGNTRGVGGKFRFAKQKITDFEEIFNTPVHKPEKLFEIGSELFREMINTGNVDRFIGNREYIEWPDGRLKYHKGLYEWRYDVE